MSKYITVGTIKTINLSNYTFTIEPIAAYRFQAKDDDADAPIIFLEDVENPSELKLIKRDVKFVFDKEFTSGLIMLKQNKTKFTVKVESLGISADDAAPSEGIERNRTCGRRYKGKEVRSRRGQGERTRFECRRTAYEMRSALCQVSGKTQCAPETRRPLSCRSLND